MNADEITAIQDAEDLPDDIVGDDPVNLEAERNNPIIDMNEFAGNYV